MTQNNEAGSEPALALRGLRRSYRKIPERAVLRNRKAGGVRGVGAIASDRPGAQAFQRGRPA
jgi:hypothetical protein